MYKVAMIGAGIIAKSHAEAIAAHTGLGLIAVCDVEKARAEAFGLPAYTDYKLMIDEQTPDIVLINLPHGLHREAAVFALSAGAHVFIEKPMANTEQECEEIIGSAKANNRLVFVGHIQRHLRELIVAKKLIQSGKYGDIVNITDVRKTDYFTDSRPRWFFDKKLAGGGILMNFGAHSLDKLKWLTGQSITSINGVTNQRLPDIEVEGDAQLLIVFDGGISATVSLCGYGEHTTHDTVIYLTKGEIIIHMGKSVWAGKSDKFEQIYVPAGGNEFSLIWEEFLDALSSGEYYQNAEYALDIIKNINKIYNG